MSGFASEWLTLREAADHKARNLSLVTDLLAYLGGCERADILDLGCGTGSNMRALAPLLPMPQHWRLVDHDPALLDAARRKIESWMPGADLAELTYSLSLADLQTSMRETITAPPNTIVTASALFDLASEDWIDALIKAIARQRSILYAVLTYNGEMRWNPPHEQDEAVRTAFNHHQQSDKGFGAALGPRAGDVLREKLESAGYLVRIGQSPWRLDRGDHQLIQENARGVSMAAAETGLVGAAGLSSWAESRPAVTACEIGHTDLLALPA